MTRRGDLVLDVFLGSATTMMACERWGRHFRGIDIDPVEEALHLTTFEAAMAGKRSAIREVWKMIEIREKWFARHAPKRPPIQRRIEPVDPRIADKAMTQLGIAMHDADAPNDADDRLLLKAWVVQVQHAEDDDVP